MDFDTSLPDWEDRILKGLPLVPELPLFKEQMEKGLRVFKRMRVPDIPGNPPLSKACDEWFFAIVAVLFGCYDPVKMTRFIQEYFLLVPKKNGKSSYSGPLMLAALILNERPSAEFQLIAPTREIATISYNQAVGTIELDDTLSDLFHVRDHIKEITYLKTKSTLKIKAADTDVITGGKQVGTLIDETHVLGGKAKASDIYTEIRGAFVSRPEAFLIQITTQSKEPPKGTFLQELKFARDVRDGVFKSKSLAVLYEFPKRMIDDGSWKKKENWKFVNPNLGRSVDIPTLEELHAKAERKSKEDLNNFYSQHLNFQIGTAQRTDNWEGAELWDGSTDPEKITFEALKQRCDVITFGVDGGGFDDIHGLAACGRDQVTGDYLMAYKGWMHPIGLERRKENIDNYEDFQEEGSLVICDDAQQDIREIAQLMKSFNELGLLPEQNAIGLDAHGIAELLDALEEAGLEKSQFAAVPQGYKLNGVIKGFARRMYDGRLWHDGTRLMSWCAGNARIEQRGNSIIITKQVSGSAKIDPLMAGFNAFHLMSYNPEASRGNINSYFSSLANAE